MSSRMPGRSTLTTTSRPSAARAACTCAIDAAASGLLVERREHLADRLAQRRARRCARASAPSNGGTRSCSFASSSAMSGGSRSRRVDIAWPNFTKIGPELLEREAQPLAARAALAALEPGPGREVEREAQRAVEVRGAHESSSPWRTSTRWIAAAGRRREGSRGLISA